MMHVHTVVIFALATAGLLVGCGQSEQPSPELADITYDDVTFDSAGLQPDPLGGEEWPALPEMADVPSCLQSEVERAVSGNERLLLFDGGCNGQTFYYRAPVMENLSDEEFLVAVGVLAVRNDRMGSASVGVANGRHAGDSYEHFQTWIYNPDTPIIDPDEGFDPEENYDSLQQTLEDDLQMEELYTESDLVFPSLRFVPTVRSWQHYVDVLNPDEVASEEAARDAGIARLEDYVDSLLGNSLGAVEEVAGCETVRRHPREHRAVVACTEDQVLLLPQLANRISAAPLITEAPDQLSWDSEPDASNTNDAPVVNAEFNDLNL